MRNLLKYVRKNKFKSLRVITAEFNESREDKVSMRTVVRVLQDHGIQNFIAVTKTFLTTKRLKRWIEWPRIHEHLTEDQWDTVMFSHETSVIVCPNTQRKKVWRKKVIVMKIVTWFQVSNLATLKILCRRPFLLVNAYL